MVVLDASAAIDMIQGNDRGQAYDAFLGIDEECIAPDHFQAEVCNAYWKYAHVGSMSQEEAAARARLGVALIDGYVATNSLIAEATAESLLHDHPIYDMLYIVLARRNDCTLFTSDKKVQALCRDMGVNCTELVDF